MTDNTDRMDDMIDRYGELCTQDRAGEIMNVSRRTIARMLEDGRLRRVGFRVDVRSICRYIEDPELYDHQARYEKKYGRKCTANLDFFEASKNQRSVK